jgi:hypothetical protein
VRTLMEPNEHQEWQQRTNEQEMISWKPSLIDCNSRVPTCTSKTRVGATAAGRTWFSLATSNPGNGRQHR